MSLYNFAKNLLNVILKFKRYEINGLEHVPGQGPLIIAANHVSLWDPIVVGCAVPRQIIYMAKEELFKVPVLGWIVNRLGAFPVKRGQGDIGAIRKSLAVLKEGHVLGIFPEGTRSKSGDIQEALAGIALIMEKSKAPILPVKIFGTQGLLTQKKGNIRVVIGKPIYIDDFVVPPDVENRRTWLANAIMHKVSSIE